MLKRKRYDTAFTNKELYHDRPCPWLTDQLKQWFPDAMNILEVGCGNGRNLFELQKEFKDIPLYGFDLSEEGINTCKKRITGEFMVGSADKLPYADNSMDVVVTVHALEQMRYIIRDVINELYRVCRYGIVLCEPFFCLQNIFGKTKALMYENVQGIPFWVEHVGFDVREFHRLSIGSYMERTGILVGLKKREMK